MYDRLKPARVTGLVFGLGLAFGLVSPPSSAAQASPEPRLGPVLRLSPTSTLQRIEGVPAQRAQRPLERVPPPEPEEELKEPYEEQLGPPWVSEGFQIQPTQRVATVPGDASDLPQAPGTFNLFRDTSFAPAGFVSSVNEPSVGGQGDGIFTSHNWFAEVSTNNGASFAFVNPFTTFPNTPAAFASGFCCDQRVAQDGSRDLVFWLLQYIKSGSTSTSTGADRLAVAHGQAGLASNSWTFYDLTATLLGLPIGTWLDFPHMQASANYLYVTSNVFRTSGDSFFGAVIVRIPLAQLDSGSPLTLDVFTTTTFGSIMPVNGASAEGTRPGRTTMYFASTTTSTSVNVLTWPEANSAPTVTTVSGLATTSFATYACPGPGGLDPCTRANARMQTGWITDTELGLMWTSAQNGAARPFPYVRTLILNPSTLAVISQPDIFSTTSAWLYPAISVNERGHLGGTVDNLGGLQFPTIMAVIRDDFSPDVTTSGWEVYSIAASNSGTAGRYGDYNGTQPHEKYPNTWLATGHTQIGGSANANAVTHNYWFGRERDTPFTATCFALTRSHTGNGSDPVATPASSSGCAVGQYVEGESISLTASPAAGWNVGSWNGTVNDPSTSTMNSATMPAAPLTVTVNYVAPCFVLTLSHTGNGADPVATPGNSAGCPAGQYVAGAAISLTASPAASWVVSGWTGTSNNASTSTSNSATMPAAPHTVSVAYLLPGLRFYTVTPCRVMDTRTTAPLVHGTVYTLQVTGTCGIPSTAQSVASNLTVVGGSALGSIAAWPANLAQPLTSSINFAQNQIRANNATLMLATDGSGRVKYTPTIAANGAVHLIVDVSGYFAP